MFKKKKNKKTLAWLGVIGMVFLQCFPVGAQAAIIASSLTNGVSVGTTNSLTDVTTAIATAENKMSGPTVNISFAADNSFKSGTMVTATATTGGFTDSTDALYFTWYIKHDDKDNGLKCDLSDTIKDDNKNCDLDGDGKITVNDWKIAAAKIIVDGAFDNTGVDYSSSNNFVGDSASGVKADPSVTDSSNGWIKNFKRDNNGDLAEENNKDAPSCYLQQPTSGIVYELSKTSQAFDSCPSGYHPSCIKDTTAVCNTGNNNNAFAACEVMKDVSASSNTATCKINNETDLKNYKATLDCGDASETALCTKDGADTDVQTVATPTILGSIFASNSSNDHMCSVVANPTYSPLIPYYDNTNPKISASAEKCSTLTDELTNGVMGSTDVVMGNTNLNNACTFEKDVNLCKHLFPYFPKKSVNGIDLSNDATGDGEFTMAEKEFWGADPTTDSTNGKQKDEAAVMGLGVDSIKWIYTTGDEIGVAVEGKSDLLTDQTETTWAFSKGVCSEMKKEVEGSTSIDDKTRSFYTEDNGSTGILTADFDLDKCLEENLVSPEDNSTGSTMAIGLTSTPSSPVNDPNGTSGDSVSVVASVQNVADLNSVYYTWNIEKISDGTAIPNNNTNWTDITTKMVGHGSLSDADRQGLGKNNLNFLLNLPAAVVDPGGNGAFYLRVLVTASENSGAGNQTSNGVIIIKVQEIGNQPTVYSAIAGDDGDLRFNNGVGAGSICSTSTEQSECDVTQNTIVGIQIPNTDNDLSGFTWTVNNVPISCDSSISSTLCSGGDGNVLFVPILGNVGESVDVVASAMSKKTGGTVETTRHFVIVDPQVTITSADTTSVWPKLLGYYMNSSSNVIDGIKTPDYSSQIFETNSGKTVTLNAAVASSWGQNQNYDWTIDGDSQNNNSNQLSFLVDRELGSAYDISLNLTNLHTPAGDKAANNLRKALLKDWGVSPADSAGEDENLSADIQLNVVDGSYQTIASSDKTGIFASLVTNLPEQLMFLLKITITGFMLIFSMGLLFAFIPESIFEKKQ